MRHLKRTADAIRKRKERKKKHWKDVFDEFEDMVQGLKNPKGKCRSMDENKMILYALKAGLKRKLAAVDDDLLQPHQISWTDIEREIAEDFNYKLSNVTELRKTFLVDGDVCVFGETDDSNFKRGAANPKYEQQNQKVTPATLMALTTSNYHLILTNDGSC